ncbi:MAG: hypothetical protein CM1200mP27_08480 [Chloroflexota bacterium]|nr:MAG: hypothetical protein CM1200mP27_08480 [Chloroflexota bacterium]
MAVGDDGNVYVSDRDNNRIQVFDSQGKFLRKWGGFGSGDGELRWPQGIAISNDGNVYVSDRGNDRIQVFDLQGGFIRKWGATGNGDGDLRFPQGMAISAMATSTCQIKVTIGFRFLVHWVNSF